MRAHRRPRLEDSPIGILRLDQSLHVLWCNSAARSLLGTQLDSGTLFHQILSYDSPETLLGDISRNHDNGTAFEARIEVPPVDSELFLPRAIRVQIDKFQRARGSPRLVATLTQLPLANVHAVSDTRSRLLELCACGLAGDATDSKPEDIIRAILLELHKLLPFDAATYHEYAMDDDGKTPFSRIRCVFDPAEPSFRWPVRWTRVADRAYELVNSKEPWIDDLNVFVEGDSEAMQNSPNIRAALSRGLKSFMIIPLKEGNTVLAALTLSSRKFKFFGPYQRELLDALEIEKVLQLIGAAYRRQAELFAGEVGKLFHSYDEPIKIAKEFVKKISKHFDWEYVGIFRVARAHAQFELVEQHVEQRDGEPHRLAFSPNYTQPLNAGVLSRVLTEGTPSRIPDVNADPGYIKLTDARSCLCYPIYIGKKIEWILDCESSQISGFGAADQRALQGIVNGLETTLSFWFESRLNQVLLGRVHQGVVVVDESGGIERLNEAAQLLLGVASEHAAKQTPLHDFGANDRAKEVLRRQRDYSDQHIRLRGDDGGERRALASAYFAPEAFNRWIWLLTDVADQRWQVGLHYLRALAQEVAGQTRGPLLLANSLVNNVSDQLKQMGTNEEQQLRQKALSLLDRASQNLAKTDITYERLASLLRTHKWSDSSRPHLVDIGALLTDFRNRLPEKERAALVLRLPATSVIARGSPGEVEPAFRSLLGYLLAFRETNSTVDCEVVGPADPIRVMLSARDHNEADLSVDFPPRDIIEEAERSGRRDAILAFEAAHKIFRRAGGELRQYQFDDTRNFVITLRVAEP
jgi:PAS domain-containing protein